MERATIKPAKECKENSIPPILNLIKTERIKEQSGQIL